MKPTALHPDALYFVTRNDAILANALDAVVESYKSGVLHEVIIQPHEEKRTPGQNSNYWISLREYLRQFNAIVNQFASDSGNNARDIKREIARRNPPEYAGIILASNEEVAHDFIKQLANVPTSTTLKKRKEFPEFTEAMNATMNDLIGQAMALQRQYAMG